MIHIICHMHCIFFSFLFLNDFQTNSDLFVFPMDNLQTSKLTRSHNFPLPKNMTHGKFLCMIYLTRAIGFPGEDMKWVYASLSLLCASPGTVAQVTADRVAQCAEKCKKLKKDWKKEELAKVWKSKQARTLWFLIFTLHPMLLTKTCNFCVYRIKTDGRVLFMGMEHVYYTFYIIAKTSPTENKAIIKTREYRLKTRTRKNDYYLF